MELPATEATLTSRAVPLTSTLKALVADVEFASNASL